eukprot:CAMPEP_0205833494 /NCGR_PEP_ID=MMETSP0206-20130828/49892_1 /ASSEMBLY_ACC=CAM_ASM_000279 /TAXON_ID=36767 /ORGANISM="Euplotes focardii, Strain TN1" /LENGTH=243 /DNA_ID=CAMNT_0053139955 /DNA_START=18 /DNA_END=749 /DNA_ORIENTATION=-
MAATAKKICAVVGAGPGLGKSVAVRFAKEGYTVALLSRKEASAQAAADAISVLGGTSMFVQTDVSDLASVQAAFQSLLDVGDVDVLVFNAVARYKSTPVLEIKADDALEDFQVNALGLLLCAQQVLPAMIGRRKGTILVTSATSAFRGSKNLASVTMSKHALKALSQTLAKEHAQDGIHVAHVRLDCGIASPRYEQMLGAKYNPENFGWPDDIADTYWMLHTQSRHAWSNEIDLRPYRENWSY